MIPGSIRARGVTFALAILFTQSFPHIVDLVINIGQIISSAQAQSVPLTKMQMDALSRYNNALNHFKSVLTERRAQINTNQPLPALPGQALYLARNETMSAYKDLTDLLPSKVGRPNKFGIPPHISMPTMNNILMNI